MMKQRMVVAGCAVLVALGCSDLLFPDLEQRRCDPGMHCIVYVVPDTANPPDPNVKYNKRVCITYDPRREE